LGLDGLPGLPGRGYTVPRLAPRWTATPAGAGATPRAVAALAVAGAAAVLAAVSVARAPAVDLDAQVARLDEGLAPARAVLRPGDRVAVSVAEDDLALRCALQYALAPATVSPVRFADCFRPGDGGACVAAASHLLLPGVGPQQAAALAGPLGFAPAAVVREGTLLVRRTR
jgi:hypothetical protein